jgi:hypothetical protein
MIAWTSGKSGSSNAKSMGLLDMERIFAFTQSVRLSP